VDGADLALLCDESLREHDPSLATPRSAAVHARLGEFWRTGVPEPIMALVRTAVTHAAHERTEAERERHEHTDAEAERLELEQLERERSERARLQRASDEVKRVEALEWLRHKRADSLNAREVDWSNQMLTDVHMVGAALLLKANASLTVLDLRSNQIGDAGAIGFCACLEVNASLGALKIHDNKFCDASRSAIAAA
jgi:hypothetical protein